MLVLFDDTGRLVNKDAIQTVLCWFSSLILLSSNGRTQRTQHWRMQTPTWDAEPPDDTLVLLETQDASMSPDSQQCDVPDRKSDATASDRS